MTEKEDFKFSIIIGIVNIILLIITIVFVIIRTYTPSTTVSIISGGLFLLFILTSYIFMINSFVSLNNLKKNTMLDDYKKENNYKTFVGCIVYSVCAFVISLIFLIIIYIRHDFIKYNKYEVLT
jgi:hypothetical protein